MEHSITKMKYLFAFLGIALLNSCYYDVEEDLYGPLDCNPTDVSYSTDVAPIMENYCNSCHNLGTQNGNVRTDIYSEVKIVADNGRLLGSIKHEDGFTAMPQGVDPLSKCNIATIEVWITEGAKDN